MAEQYDNTNKGALWVKESKKWLKYLGGGLDVEWTEYRVSVFKNSNKKSANAPEYNILLTKKEEKKKMENIENSDLPF